MMNVHKRRCFAAINTLSTITRKGILVDKQRLTQLNAIRDNIDRQDAYPLNVAAVNFGDDMEIEVLTTSMGYAPSGIINVLDDGWQVACELMSAEYDAIVLRLAQDMRDVDMATIAMAFLSARPLVVLANHNSPASVLARGNTLEAVPVMMNISDVAYILRYSVPTFVVLRDRIKADVHERTGRYKRVNPWVFGTKRALVALIPGGVFSMNLLGTLRVVLYMMHDTGMKSNRAVSNVVARMAAMTTLTSSVFDVAGDVYQYLVCAVVIADIAQAFAADGAAAALATIDALDAVLLGSVSVVTGTISGIVGYYTRPKLVDSVAGFLSNLQLMYLQHPAFRRPDV